MLIYTATCELNSTESPYKKLKYIGDIQESNNTIILIDDLYDWTGHADIPYQVCLYINDKWYGIIVHANSLIRTVRTNLPASYQVFEIMLESSIELLNNRLDELMRYK